MGEGIARSCKTANSPGISAEIETPHPNPAYHMQENRGCQAAFFGKRHGMRQSLPLVTKGSLCLFAAPQHGAHPCLPLGEGGSRSETDEGRGALTICIAVSAKRSCSPTLISQPSADSYPYPLCPFGAFPPDRGNRPPGEAIWCFPSYSACKIRRCLPAGGASPSPTLRRNAQ